MLLHGNFILNNFDREYLCVSNQFWTRPVETRCRRQHNCFDLFLDRLNPFRSGLKILSPPNTTSEPGSELSAIVVATLSDFELPWSARHAVDKPMLSGYPSRP